MNSSFHQISEWLASVGLHRYASHFEDLREEDFLSLQMTDYERYGLTTIDDKQRLFRLIKRLVKTHRSRGQSQAARPHVTTEAPVERHAATEQQGLLDLDADDGDLLTEAQGDAFLDPGPRPAPTAVVRGPPPPKIRVVVRKRPINKKEKERGEDDIMEVDMAKGELVVNEPKLRVDLTRYTERHRFVFDDALAERVSNDDVYRSTVQPLVQTLFWGGKATCFAYGQTGSGKTYTMTPLPLKSADEIFSILSNREFKNYYLYVSCFEIYGGKIFDLLNSRKKLEIREDSKRRVVVVGLKEFATDSLSFIQTLIHRASSTRSTGTTGANTDSSRSHSIMQFAIKKGNKAGVSLVGKISFIDLAGSERGADTCDNNRQTRLEGAEINKSLLALKECIRALDCEARHVPFRGSKLTAVLRDSFVGKEARTVMIANVSPNSLSVEHSLNTLRYADRVKELRKEKSERSTSLVTPGRLLPTGYCNTTIHEEVDTGLDPFIDPVSQEAKKAQTAAAPAIVVAQNSKKSDTSSVESLSFHVRQKSTHSIPEEPFEEDAYDRPHRQTHSCIDYDNLEDETSILEEDYPLPPPAPSQGPVTGSEQPSRDTLVAQHEVVMNDILDGEEVVIDGHRRMIESLMELVKEEMNMLSEVDQPGSAIDKYIERLDKILTEKSRIIASMQSKVDDFKAKLGQEEELSQALGSLR